MMMKRIKMIGVKMKKLKKLKKKMKKNNLANPEIETYYTKKKQPRQGRSEDKQKVGYL